MQSRELLLQPRVPAPLERAAGAANICGESEESLNGDELGKNVKASKITRLLSWRRYRSLKDGATGFP